MAVAGKLDRHSILGGPRRGVQRSGIEASHSISVGCTPTASRMIALKAARPGQMLIHSCVRTHGDGGVARFAEILTRTSMGTAAGTTEDLESPEYQEDVNARRFGRA